MRDQRRRETEMLSQGCISSEYPVLVKPARGGSSIILRDKPPEHLKSLRWAREHNSRAPSGIRGREIECSVIDGRHGAALVPGEIVVHDPDGFYD